MHDPRFLIIAKYEKKELIHCLKFSVSSEEYLRKLISLVLRFFKFINIEKRKTKRIWENIQDLIYRFVNEVQLSTF